MDDIDNVERPLIFLDISEVFIEITKDTRMLTNFEFTTELHYFNIEALEWEPILEPFGMKGLVTYHKENNP